MSRDRSVHNLLMLPRSSMRTKKSFGKCTRKSRPKKPTRRLKDFNFCSCTTFPGDIHKPVAGDQALRESRQTRAVNGSLSVDCRGQAAEALRLGAPDNPADSPRAERGAPWVFAFHSPILYPCSRGHQRKRRSLSLARNAGGTFRLVLPNSRSSRSSSNVHCAAKSGVTCRRRSFLGESISSSITRNAREQSDV